MEQTQENKEKEEPQSIVDRAEAAGKKLEEERVKMEELLKKVELDKANVALGGQSSSPAKEVKEEESDYDYSQRVLQGKI